MPPIDHPAPTIVMGCAASTEVPRMSNELEPVDREVGAQSFHEKYVIRKKLGKGAFSQVYVARAATGIGGAAGAAKAAGPVGRAVAVKVTALWQRGTKPGAEVDRKLQQSAVKEANIMWRLGEQGHCVGIREEFMDNLFSYIIMEKCDHTLLQALEHSPQLTEHTYVQIFTQMLKAISAIHAVAIVHRDVKPDNFLCNSCGDAFVVKLCDFGLAEAVVAGGPLLKGVYGTAPFMSPEMLSVQGYRTQTDIWSLGVIIYVLLLGQFPYVPVDNTAKAMKAAIASGVPEPSFKAMCSLKAIPLAPGGAISFMRSALCRDPDTRLTAASALQHPWLVESSTESFGTSSLRSTLNAAKRAGAFDCRTLLERTDVDVLLATMQAEVHGAGGQGGPEVSRPPSGNGRRCDRTHSESSADTPTARPDATFVQSNVSTGTGGSTASRRSRIPTSRDLQPSPSSCRAD